MPAHVFREASKGERESGEFLHIGLINNMPDGALEATERQFLNILNSATEGIDVRLSLFALPDVSRTPPGQLRIDRFYAGTDTLWDCRLDGIIVTGAEPRMTDLRQESYWDSLTKVVEWAEQHTQSAIWSCLAAHGAVLYLDGVERRRLPEKRFGVFECVHATDDQLTNGISSCFRVPHSRWNDLAEQDLSDSGYCVLSHDRDGGVDIFLKQRKSLFVFCQGHPEYETDTLLLEHRRDIGSFLKGERDEYPAPPLGYFDDSAVGMLASLRADILSGRCRELPGALFSEQFVRGIANTWTLDARRIYSNWIRYLCTQRERSRRERPFSVAI